MQIVRPSVQLVCATPNAEKLIELAGRVCWKSEDNITDDSYIAFIKMLLSKGHLSVLEHPTASFSIVGDRGMTHELVRSRIASYSQESTRFCNYSQDRFGNEITVIEPEGLTETQRSLWLHAMEEAEEMYFMLLKSGLAPQIARAVLPTCLKAEIFVTMNFRAWLHFLSIRDTDANHPLIHWVAQCVRTDLNKIAPTVFPLT